MPVKPSDLIIHMKSVADDFSTIRNPYAGEFAKVEKAQYYLEKIRDFDSIVLYPVVIAAFYKFWQPGDLGKKKEFGNILQLCFRYFVRNKTIGSASPTSLEGKMKKITKEIMKNNWGLKEIKDELIIQDTKTYTPKDVLELYFRDSYQVKDETVATYLLEELENELDPIYGIRYTKEITVEHIMPKSITKWKDDIIVNEGYTGTEDEKTKQAKAYWKEHWLKLGNLTLLHGLKNTKAGNKKFADKLPIYKNDGYAITAEIEANYTQWSSTELLQRHNDLCTKLLAMFDIENFPT